MHHQIFYSLRRKSQDGVDYRGRSFWRYKIPVSKMENNLDLFFFSHILWYLCPINAPRSWGGSPWIRFKSLWNCDTWTIAIGAAMPIRKSRLEPVAVSPLFGFRPGLLFEKTHRNHLTCFMHVLTPSIPSSYVDEWWFGKKWCRLSITGTENLIRSCHSCHSCHSWYFYIWDDDK